MKFRCYVTKIGKNSDIEYIACCITINLLSIGTIKEHTIKNLELLINDYINFYKENNKLKLVRPAPMFMYFNYILCLFLGNVCKSKDHYIYIVEKDIK